MHHLLFRVFGLCIILLSVFQSHAAPLGGEMGGGGGGGGGGVERVSRVMRKSRCDGQQGSAECANSHDDRSTDESENTSFHVQTPHLLPIIFTHPWPPSSSSPNTPVSSPPYSHPNNNNNNKKRSPRKGKKEEEKMREPPHHSHASWGYCAGQCKICRRYPPEPGLVQVVDCEDADLYWLPAPEEEYRLCPVLGGKTWLRCIGYEPEDDDRVAWKAWVKMEEERREAEAQRNGGRDQGFLGGGLDGLW